MNAVLVFLSQSGHRAPKIIWIFVEPPGEQVCIGSRGLTARIVCEDI
jgi:hypothetical protein